MIQSEDVYLGRILIESWSVIRLSVNDDVESAIAAQPCIVPIIRDQAPMLEGRGFLFRDLK